MTAQSHGYLIDPPSRSSAWRAGYDTPKNYDDMQLWCGGLDVQHKQNNGYCGLCGDNFALAERPNEPGPGNVYATGTIVGSYKQGKSISVTFTITAAHLGYVEFKLCDNDEPQLGLDASVRATKECIDEYPLKTKDGADNVSIGSDAGDFTVKLQLPQKVKCTNCILHWRYRTGNNWGVEIIDGVKYEGLGYGPQEEFHNCADIKIKKDKKEKTTTTESSVSTTTSGSAKCYGLLNMYDSWCASYCPTGVPCPTTMCWCEGQPLPYMYVCEGESWCNEQCNHVPPYCPAPQCTCQLQQVDPRVWY